jgi:hypothetical protein
MVDLWYTDLLHLTWIFLQLIAQQRWRAYFQLQHNIRTSFRLGLCSFKWHRLFWWVVTKIVMEPGASIFRVQENVVWIRMLNNIDGGQDATILTLGRGSLFYSEGGGSRFPRTIDG